MAVSKRLRFEILRRDNHTCRYCGRAAPDVKLVVDHVKPETLGGRTEPANLVTACDDCNAGKSSVAPDSPLVDDVERDAIRWAQAVRLAADAMVEESWAVEQRNAGFRDAWNQWKTQTASPTAVPLPDDWAATIDRFRAAGMNDALLTEAITAAMKAPNVRLDRVFRYFCGVCWRMIGDLQDRAKAIVDTLDGE